MAWRIFPDLLRSIGPVWDGNEVWLLAAGGTLYFAFPRLYAVAFSGFYLPLIMVLWLLMGRGIAIELRGHVDDPLWKSLWDAIFAVSSALLALFFGVALGNVVRGVPMTSAGYFFSPLWTDFRLDEQRGIIDWYTLISGVAALAALAMHGSLKIGASFSDRPWGVLFPLIAIVGLTGVRRYGRRGDELRAFLSSCAYLLGMLTSAVFGLYPWVLPAGPDARRSLTLTDAATSQYGLTVGLLWFLPGMILVAGYFVYSYRSFAGKVDPSEGC